MSKRTERKMAWPLEPGVAPKINELVAGLVDEMDAVAPDSGGAILLVEMRAEDGDEFLRLAERLAAAWKAQERSTLVVDAHPAEPFAGDCFEGSPEGLTEILHYGLSPEAAAQQRDGCSGLWIPAGGKWSLPLESPDEPGLTLYRLAGLADRVLLLADAADAEGFLEAFRDRCHYRMMLVSPEEAEDLPPLPVGEPVLAEESDAVEEEAAPESPTAEATAPRGENDEGEAPKGISVLNHDEPKRRRGRLLLLLILLPILAVAWYFALGPGGGDEPETLAAGPDDQDSGFSHLPAPANLPYNGVPDEETTDQPTTETGQEQVAADADVDAEEQTPRLGETVYPAEEGANDGDATESGTPAEMAEVTDDATDDATPPVTEPREREPAAEPRPVEPRREETAAPSPRRRFESRAAWNRTLTHRGEFHVHVESYQDSLLGVQSARARGFQGAGFELSPSDVRGKTYYRLLVGPFAELPTAAAFRDSLLDHTDENYCTIAIGASE